MSKLRRAALAFANLLAPPLYGLGLLSPLTPSDGIPSATHPLIFAGLPLAIPLYSAFAVRDRVMRGLLLLEAAAIAGCTAWLLKLQLRL